MHRQMIEKIILEGNIQQMIELKDVLLGLIDDLKTEDYDAYLCAEYEIHKILYGTHIGEDLARCWVSKMKNKDGTTGEHWTKEKTTEVMLNSGFKFDESDWYVVLNMVYSDMYNAKFDLATYVSLAKDWLSDEDVSSEKLLKYYYYIVMCK